MNQKGIVKYLAAICLVAVIGVVLYKQGAFEQLRNVSLPGYLFALALLFCAYAFSGIQIYYLLRSGTTVTMKRTDIVLLPFSMNMFSYIIPANGGMIFSILFLKAKYQIDFVKSFSIGFGLVFIMLMLNGMFGLYFCLTAHLGVGFFLASLIFLLSPLLAFAVSKLLSALNVKSGSFLFRLKDFIRNALEQSLSLLANRRALLFMTFTSLIVILLNIVLYYWINTVLGTGLSLAASSITILLLNISSLVRIVPGNIGVEELIASAIFGISGSDPMTGAVITLFLRAVNLSLTVPLGIVHTVLNYRIIIEPLAQIRKSTQQK